MSNVSASFMSFRCLYIKSSIFDRILTTVLLVMLWCEIVSSSLLGVFNVFIFPVVLKWLQPRLMHGMHAETFLQSSIRWNSFVVLYLIWGLSRDLCIHTVHNWNGLFIFLNNTLLIGDNVIRLFNIKFLSSWKRYVS